MAKIVIKNILRSFGIGLLAVLVTGIVILLLLLLMGLIILFLYWIKVEEKVINRIKPRDISKDVEILKNYIDKK